MKFICKKMTIVLWLCCFSLLAQPGQPQIQIFKIGPGRQLLPDSYQTIFPFPMRNLTFEFQGNNFPDPAAVQYQHRLVGFDSTWTSPGRATTVHFLNLSSGTYRFEVRARENSQIFSEISTSVSFQIKAPFWHAFWFLPLVILLLVAVFYRFHFWQNLIRFGAHRTVSTENGPSLPGTLENFNFSPIPIYVKDHALRFTFANQAFLQLTGQTMVAIAGKTGTEINFREVGWFLAEKERQVIENVAAVEYETSVQIQGKTRIFSASLSPIKTDEFHVVGILGCLFEITSLLSAREATRQALLQKCNFLTDMSHEIRTSMSGIIGVTDLMADTILNQQQNQYVFMIKTSATRLLNVLNNILDYSRFQAGNFELQNAEFNLRSVLEDVTDFMRFEVEKKQLELILYIHHAVPLQLIGDAGHLKQVLVNLVGNAVKFSNQGEVMIKAELSELQSHSVTLHFKIKDAGPGIPQEQQYNVFDCFPRTDKTSISIVGGAGLGLTISKKIVNLFGGQIWVESEPGQGSEFHFTAKFEIRKSVFRIDSINNVEIRGMKLLAVANNATNRLILSEMLLGFDCMPHVVNSSIYALELLQQENQFQMIITDIQLPELDGPEFIVRLRQIEKYAKIPVLLLTSVGMGARVDELKALGYLWTLNKPVKLGQLLEAMVVATSTSPFTNNPKSIRQRIKNMAAVYLLHLSRLKNQSRILLVEDDLVNQKVFVALLKKTRIPFDLAINGVQALERVRENEYDLVLMDVNMPKMDGLTATRHIRRQSKNKKLPIIALTAVTQKSIREKCLAAGMNDYLSKPIEADALFHLICKWLPKLKMPNRTHSKNEESRS